MKSGYDNIKFHRHINTRCFPPRGHRLTMDVNQPSCHNLAQVTLYSILRSKIYGTNAVQRQNSKALLLDRSMSQALHRLFMTSETLNLFYRPPKLLEKFKFIFCISYTYFLIIVMTHWETLFAYVNK